jgi:hypothetical protein
MMAITTRSSTRVKALGDFATEVLIVPPSVDDPNKPATEI